MRFILSILIVIFSIISLTIGNYPITISDIFELFYSLLTGEAVNEIHKNILLEIRLPRIVGAILIGSALSVSGVTFQSIFVNPLVSPAILGVLAGASFGASLGMIFSSSWLIIQILTFIFALLAVAFAVAITYIYRENQIVMLVLGGVISSALFSSLLSITKYIADPYDKLPSIVYWLMGSLSMIKSDNLVFYIIIFSILLLLITLMSKYLNILSLGETEAKTLGVDVVKIRLIFILIATILSSLTVVLAGVIGWIGLIIPHISRMLVGANNSKLVPVSILLGGLFLLVVDTISRTIFTVEIPIGILTSLVGIPIFLLTLKNSKKGWA